MPDIKEAIELWRTTRLKYDPSLKNPDDGVDAALLDLITFLKRSGFTEADLAEELDDNPRSWVENEYVRVQKM